MSSLALIAALALAGQEGQQTPAAAPPPAAKGPASKPSTPKPGEVKETGEADRAVSSVTVSGARQQVETSIDRRSYSVANDLNGKTGTIGDVLRNVPSVQVDMQGNVSLRGDANVTVLVDGRPSAQFSRDNLPAALQSVPADQIERIEVITNPSAEFRADGSAGIINLVMKKARGAGRTGSVRANVTSTGSYDATLSNGFNDNKLSVVESLGFRHGRLRTHGLFDRTLIAGGGSADRITGAADPDGVQGRVGVDYDLDKTTRLSSTAAISWQAGPQVFIDDFSQANPAGTPILAFGRRSDTDVKGINGQLDFTLRKRWSEAHTFTLNAAASTNEGLNTRLDTTTPVLPAGAPFAIETERNNFNRRSALTADYLNQVAGMQLKAGYLFEYTDNLIKHAGRTGPSAAGLVTDPTQTDNFSDVETHNNGYVTLQKTVGKLTTLGGLRAETVHLDLDQRTLGMSSEQDYAKLYPTLHLGYALDKGRTLTANYSKRVTRPLPVDFDPFRFTTNAYTAIQGNPRLKPQATDSYELGYEQRNGQAFTLVTAYYRQTNNAFSTVLTDLGGGLLLQTRANLGYQSSTGAEWTMGDKLSPKLTYNVSANIFQTRIGGGALGAIGETSAVTGFGRANLNWQATKKDFVQINLFANSKQLLRQGYIDPSFSGNFGYRHTITDKVSLTVVVRDPFATLDYRAVLNTPTGREVRVQHDQNRSISIGLLWSFAGKPRDTGFDFAPGGTGAGGAAP